MLSLTTIATLEETFQVINLEWSRNRFEISLKKGGQMGRYTFYLKESGNIQYAINHQSREEKATEMILKKLKNLFENDPKYRLQAVTNENFFVKSIF